MLKKIIKKILYIAVLVFLIAAAVDYAYGGRFYTFAKNKVCDWWGGKSVDNAQKFNAQVQKELQKSVDTAAKTTENNVHENGGEGQKKVLWESFDAAEDEFFTAAFWRKASVDDVLKKIDEGKQINARNKNGMSILMYAAMITSQPEVVAMLIEHGADVAARDENGRTALMWAAAFSDTPDILETLVDYGADTEQRDKQGRTALMYAVGYNPHLPVAQTLIDCGARINAQVRAQPSALQKATLPNQFLEITKLSLSAANDFIGKMYNKLGDEIIGDQLDAPHETVLAALEGTLDDLAGKIINPKEGMTPLMFAAKSASSDEVVKLLLKNGADARIYDDKGKTFLDYAKENPILFNTDIYWKINDKMYQ